VTIFKKIGSRRVRRLAERLFHRAIAKWKPRAGIALSGVDLAADVLFSLNLNLLFQFSKNKIKKIRRTYN